ncbi:uncharacterized protein LOC116804624 [Drosophila mojavensis]|uniref:uncharacterized protein LOC116804624 n=1 Tax=Drosophila mojavensis TaxID=7230 RepID=UPI0013EE9DB6|nr:uncharacterized protein LOC116804624 [Drosophila mojavensis]
MVQFLGRKRAAGVDSDEENKTVGTPKKSEVWKYFEKGKDGCAVCRKCFKVCKTSGNTTNVKNHLTRMHPSLQESELAPKFGSILHFVNKKYEATSAESERMFSKAGMIANSRRASFNPETDNKLTFLNKNQWVL